MIEFLSSGQWGTDFRKKWRSFSRNVHRSSWMSCSEFGGSGVWKYSIISLRASTYCTFSSNHSSCTLGFETRVSSSVERVGYMKRRLPLFHTLLYIIHEFLLPRSLGHAPITNRLLALQANWKVPQLLRREKNRACHVVLLRKREPVHSHF